MNTPSPRRRTSSCSFPLLTLPSLNVRSLIRPCVRSARNVAAATLALGVLYGGSLAQAGVLAYEKFGYALANGANLNGVATNAPGLTGNYTVTALGGGTSTFQTAGLTFSPNFLPCSGGAVLCSVTGANNYARLGVALNAGTVTGTVYTSYLANFSTLGTVAGPIASSHLNSTTGGTDATCWFRSDVAASVTLKRPGVGYDATEAAATTGNLVSGTTYLVVSKFTNVGSALSAGSPGVATTWVFTQAAYDNWYYAGALESQLGTYASFTAAESVTSGTFTFNNTRFAQLVAGTGAGAAEAVTFDELRYGTELVDVVKAITPLLDNPGFESGATAWNLPAGATITTVSGEFQAGAQAVKVVATGGPLAVTQDVQLKLLPGLYARISGYIKTGPLDPGVSARIVIRHNYPAPAPSEDLVVGVASTANTAYRLYSEYFWVPLGVTSSEVRLELTGNGTAYFDTCKLDHVTGKQLVTNRGFEGGTTAGWAFSAGTSVSTTAGTIHTGTKSAKIVPTGILRTITQDPIVVAPYQTFTVKGWIQTAAIVGSAYIEVRNFDSAGAQLFPVQRIGTLTGTAAYTQFTATVTTPANAARTLLYLRADGASGTAYFDDISICDGDGTVKAFPGATGFGTTTTGGRGTITGGVSNTSIYRVTSLDGIGTGPGTIRAAMNQVGPRIVVFAVAGIIDLGPTRLLIPSSSPGVTIAGQTAPGAGICLKNSGLDCDTHDVIMRGIRFRTGGHPDPDLHPAASDFQAACGGTGSYGCPAEVDTTTGPNPGYDQDNRDSATIDEDANDNLIFDHCSFAWSTDELLQIWRGDTKTLSNITVSYSTFMEPLRNAGHEDTSYADRHNHDFCMLIGNTQNISVHHNLFCNARKRVPLIDGNVTLEFVDNVIYNHTYAAAHVEGNSAGADKVAFIGNYVMKGLSSSSTGCLSIDFPNVPNTGSIFYLENNFGFERQVGTDPEWNIATGNVPPAGDPMRAASRVAAFTPSDLVPDDAITNKDTLLGQVASRVNRPGVFPLDPIDLRAIRHAVSGLSTPFTKDNGVDQGVELNINTEAQNVGDPNFVQAPGTDNLGWHNYTGTAPVDNDGDGIPGYWENAFGLSDSDPTDAKMVSAEGEGNYLNIEVYINSLLPPVGE